MKKMNVTGFCLGRGVRLNKGDVVTIVHNPQSDSVKYDPKALDLMMNDQRVGSIGNKYGYTVLAGTHNNEKLFDEMIERNLADENGVMTLTGVIVDEGEITFNNGQKKRGYVIEVELPSVTAENGDSAKVLEFELTIRGSVKEYSGKTIVLRELQLGNTPSIGLKKDGDKMITVIQRKDGDIKAGVVSKVKKGDESQLDEYLKALEKRGAVQLVQTVSALGNAYTVRFEVDRDTFQDTLAGKWIRTLDEVRQEVISQGIVEEGTLQEIERYLQVNKVPPKHIKKIFESMRKYGDEVSKRIPNPVVKYKDTDGLVKKAIVYLNKGKHLRFIGEKGVGKNVLIETLAWIYQRPLFEMALNSQTDKMDILGSKTFETTLDENGNERTFMSFDKEVLVEAMEVGGFMNFDEVNTADPSVLVLLHPIADGRGRLEVPGYGLVTADPNFALILSMNRDYIGTTQLNEATRDRFVPMVFPNSKSIAEMLLMRVPGANPEDVNLVDRVYGSIMKLVQDGQLTNDCITNRGFIDALEVADDLGLQEALLDNVANRIEDEEYRNTVISIIDDIVG